MKSEAATSIFDVTSLFAELDLRFDEVDRNDSLVFKMPADFSWPGSEDEILQIVEPLGILEHEYFHCRHVLSSSIGYFIFLLNQRSIMARTNLLRSLPFKEFFNSGLPLTRFLNSNSSVPVECKRYFTELVREYYKWNVLTDFCESSLSAFYEINRIDKESGFYPHVAGAPEFPDICFSPSDHLLSAYKSSPTLLELIEGIAVWKEFGYISLIILKNTPQCFQSATRKWLERNFLEPRYNRAASIILEHAGCNLASALSGILMDIALCGPLFGRDKYSWEEIHPSLRLRKILSIADSIPASIKTIDYCNLISEEVYTDIEKAICQALGWTSVSNNIQFTLDALASRIQYGHEQEQLTEGATDCVGRFYDRRFLVGLKGRDECISMQLFPWHSSKSVNYIKLTSPSVTIFKDKIVINRYPDEEKLVIALYICDLMLNLFTEGTMNPHIFNDLTKDRFSRARRIYLYLLNEFDEDLLKLLDIQKSKPFEYFISQFFKIEYDKFVMEWRPSEILARE